MSCGRSDLLFLQHADSAFPSGAVAFSQGIETLRSEEHLNDEHSLARFLDNQLRYRWATGDRAVLAAAWEAAGDLDAIAAADRVQETTTLALELREGSKRAGRALLGVHRELGTSGAADYRARLTTGHASGHLSAVQGLVWRGVGLSCRHACVASPHTLCVGLLGAALRLSIIGHIAAQRILSGLHPCLVEILDTAPPGLDALTAYTPVTDIALMRHETLAVRLFSN